MQNWGSVLCCALFLVTIYVGDGSHTVSSWVPGGEEFWVSRPKVKLRTWSQSFNYLGWGFLISKMWVTLCVCHWIGIKYDDIQGSGWQCIVYDMSSHVLLLLIVSYTPLHPNFLHQLCFTDWLPSQPQFIILYSNLVYITFDISTW